MTPTTGEADPARLPCRRRGAEQHQSIMDDRLGIEASSFGGLRALAILMTSDGRHRHARAAGDPIGVAEESLSQSADSPPAGMSLTQP